MESAAEAHTEFAVCSISGGVFQIACCWNDAASFTIWMSDVLKCSEIQQIKYQVITFLPPYYFSTSSKWYRL